MRTNDARMVHKLVRETAEDLAAAFYNHRASRDNLFYKEWPSERAFARKNWRNFITYARQTLGQILAGNYPEQMKVEIYEALVADGSLPYSVRETQIVNVPH